MRSPDLSHAGTWGVWLDIANAIASFTCVVLYIRQTYLDTSTSESAINMVDQIDSYQSMINFVFLVDFCINL